MYAVCSTICCSIKICILSSLVRCKHAVRILIVSDMINLSKNITSTSPLRDLLPGSLSWPRTCELWWTAVPANKDCQPSRPWTHGQPIMEEAQQKVVNKIKGRTTVIQNRSGRRNVQTDTWHNKWSGVEMEERYSCSKMQGWWVKKQKTLTMTDLKTF